MNLGIVRQFVLTAAKFILLWNFSLVGRHIVWSGTGAVTLPTGIASGQGPESGRDVNK